MPQVDTTIDTQSSSSSTVGGITTTTTTYKRTYHRNYVDLDGKLIWSVSSNGRYLVNAGGEPVLLISDSPQGMLVALSFAEMDSYFATRAAQGFNASQIHALSGPTYGGGVNGETFDSIAPFNTPGDISTPNSTYFGRLVSMLVIAASYNIIVILNAAEWSDWTTTWKNNGNTKCFNFGVYLGNLCKDIPNIVWNVGNDFQTWSTDQDSVDALCNVIDGIKSVDTNHIHTCWLDYYVSASRNSSDFASRIDLDWAYSYYIMYDLIETERALSPSKPVYLGESYYEEYTSLGLTGVPWIFRYQQYWAMLAGACGITYGTLYYDFSAGWLDAMDDPGALQIQYFKALFEAYPWWTLVPDTANDILTAGYGTKRTGAVQPDAADPYCICAAAADGSLAMIYMPTDHSMDVDMSTFSGTVTCRWYDPTDGSYTADAASPHANSGTHTFSRAGANHDGDHDWVLVLETV